MVSKRKYRFLLTYSYYIGTNLKNNIMKDKNTKEKKGHYHIIMQGTIVAIIWLLLAKQIIIYLSPNIPTETASGISKSTGSAENMGISTLEFILYLPFGAIWEEIVFRLLPLLVCMGIILIGIILGKIDENNSKIYKKFFVYTIILSSIVFGYLHGNIVNIFIQGIAGFIFFMVWLAVYDIKRSIIISTLASSMTHLCDNVFLTCMAALAKSLKRLIYYYM